MSTWSGWIIQFLNRANVLNTPPNQTFMSEWASHSPGSCHFNPVILSTKVTGSSNCGATTAGFGHTQNYGTHAEAAHAFSIQMHTAWVKPLLDALNSGNPFQIGDRSKVVAVLRRWGDEGFASWYANANNDGTSGSHSGSGGKSAAAHSGWKHLRRSINKNMPKALRTSERNTAAALRSLSRGRKVRL